MFQTMGFPAYIPLNLKRTSASQWIYRLPRRHRGLYGPGTSGSAPLTIQFKDLSTKMEDTTHTSWAWDFQNDGTTDSTSQNPCLYYTANGTYTVKLTATNAGGSDTEIKTGYITVSELQSTTSRQFHCHPKERNGTSCGDIHRYINELPDLLEMGIQERHRRLDAVFHCAEPIVYLCCGNLRHQSYRNKCCGFGR